VSTVLEVAASFRWGRLGDHVTKIGSGFTPLGGHSSYVRSGVPFIRSQNVHMNRFDRTGLAFITPEQDALMNMTRVAEGDVLLNITGASIGRVCVVPPEIVPANVNQHVSIIRTNGSVEPEFLSLFLSSPDFQRFICDTQAGATRQALTKSLIEDFRIPLLEIGEQRRVAGLLKQQIAIASRARAAAEVQLEAAFRLQDAYLREFLAVAASCQSRTFAEICCDGGQYGTSNSFGRAAGIPVLGMANIRDGNIVWNGARCADPTHDDIAKYRLHCGDILFNRTNSAELVGKSAVFDGSRDAIFASYLIRFRMKRDTADPRYVCSYINSPAGRSFVQANMGRAIGQVNISASTMMKMPIPLPRLEQQRSLAAGLAHRLNEVEMLRTKIREQIGSITALAPSLLRRAFNGEL